MSRIGKQPIPIPQGVKVQIDNGLIRAEGPKGKLSQPVPAGMAAKLENNVLTITRDSDHRTARAMHGLTRALVANMVTGVKDGFERKLDIVGIGYRAQLQGRNIQLALGYSHPVIFPLPETVTAEIERQVAITLRAPDKALLGETAAKLRALRKPDPYKGKGIKYSDEVIRRKVGKKAGAGAK
jgi:large subunit ribosomal protein L6